MGKVWEDEGALQGDPRRTGCARLRQTAAGTLGPGHKMAAVPLGFWVREPGPGVRCSRLGRRRQLRSSQSWRGGQAEERGKTDIRKLEERKEGRVYGGQPRGSGGLRAKGKAGVVYCSGAGGQATELPGKLAELKASAR